MGDAYIYKDGCLRTAIEAVSFLLLEKASAVFGAEAEKHRRSRAAAAKRYKRKARWRHASPP